MGKIKAGPERVLFFSVYDCAIIRTAQQAEKVAIAGDVYAFLATGEESGGTYALIEARVPSGGGPPPHTQCDVELFYVLLLLKA